MKLIQYTLLLAPALLLAACGSKDKSAAKPGAPGKGAPIPVTVYVVKSSAIENQLLSTGTLLPNEEVELRPEAAGKITSITFNEGELVRKGQVLVRINDAELQAQVKKLRLQLQLNLEREQRLKSLLAINGVSQEEYDIALNQYNGAKAELEYYEALLDKTIITAPFNGVIGIRNVSPGSYISSTTPVASLLQTDPLKVEFSVPEKYLGSLKTGKLIRFEVEGNDKTFDARIAVIEPKVDAATRSVKVRALAANPKGELTPGAFARVSLGMNADNNALMIPTEAIIPILKGKMVYVMKNGKAEEAKIQTGFRNDSMVQVLSGLEPGDSVVTTGIMQVKKGASLTLKATR